MNGSNYQLINYYHTLYGTAGVKDKVQVSGIPGYFYIPNNPNDPGHSGLANATCLGTNGICVVTVTSTKSLGTGADATMITSDINQTYDPGTTTLILNDDDEKPTSLQITSLSVTFKGENAYINYK